MRPIFAVALLVITVNFQPGCHLLAGFAASDGDSTDATLDLSVVPGDVAASADTAQASDTAAVSDTAAASDAEPTMCPFEMLASPDNVVDDDDVGGVAWAEPTRVRQVDGEPATVSLQQDNITHYLAATQFGLALPADAVVVGITVEWRVRGDGPAWPFAVRLIRNGNIGDEDRSDEDPWPPVFEYRSYGGPADRWGERWSPAVINSADFGVALSATVGIGVPQPVLVKVDHVQIRIRCQAPCQ